MSTSKKQNLCHIIVGSFNETHDKAQAQTLWNIIGQNLVKKVLIQG